MKIEDQGGEHMINHWSVVQTRSEIADCAKLNTERRKSGNIVELCGLSNILKR